MKTESRSKFEDVIEQQVPEFLFPKGLSSPCSVSQMPSKDLRIPSENLVLPEADKHKVVAVPL